MDTACESLHHSFIIKYRWLNAGETLSRTLGNSCVSSVSCHRFTLLCIRLIISVITTYVYELYLCYVRGEQLDKLCFSASHLIRYWKMYNYMHMQCLCILCIFWEIKHLNLKTWTLVGILLKYLVSNFISFSEQIVGVTDDNDCDNFKKTFGLTITFLKRSLWVKNIENILSTFFSPAETLKWSKKTLKLWLYEVLNSQCCMGHDFSNLNTPKPHE